MPDGEGFYGPGEWSPPKPPADSGFDWNLINQAIAAGIPPLGLWTGGAGAWKPPSFQWGQEPIEGAQLNYEALAKFGIIPGDSTELMRAKIEAYIDSETFLDTLADISDHDYTIPSRNVVTKLKEILGAKGDSQMESK